MMIATSKALVEISRQVTEISEAPACLVASSPAAGSQRNLGLKCWHDSQTKEPKVFRAATYHLSIAIARSCGSRIAPIYQSSRPGCGSGP